MSEDTKIDRIDDVTSHMIITTYVLRYKVKLSIFKIKYHKSPSVKVDEIWERSITIQISVFLRNPKMNTNK